MDLSYFECKDTVDPAGGACAEAEGKKLKPKQAVELRKMGKEITKEAVEKVLAGERSRSRRVYL